MRAKEARGKGAGSASGEVFDETLSLTSERMLCIICYTEFKWDFICTGVCMACDVFISYSHKDKVIADAVCAKLEQDGFRCWYAPRDIRPGANWAEAIMETIETVKIMVVIFTDNTNGSQQVLNEISNAARAGVIIIPFKLTATEPSRGLQYYFTAVHWLDAVDAPLEKSILSLSKKVASILGADGQASTETEGTAAEPQKNKKARKLFLIISLGLILVIAVICVFFAVRQQDERGNTRTKATSAPTPEAVTEASPLPTASPTPQAEITSVVCSFCNGTGKCPGCVNGKVRDDSGKYTAVCARCGGSGICSYCFGRGYIRVFSDDSGQAAVEDSIRLAEEGSVFAQSWFGSIYMKENSGETE